MKIKTFYKCDFCGFKIDKEDWMVVHEEECPYNEKNKACYTCSNYNSNYGCSWCSHENHIEDEKFNIVEGCDDYDN